MNWHHNEPEQDEETYEDADKIMAILEKHKVTTRGHSIFWAQPQMQQNWLRKLTAEQLKYQMIERMQNIMVRYRDRVIHWDVNHEMLHGRFYREQLQNNSIPVWMFKQARVYDKKAKLFLNDYDVITQGGRCEEYKDFVISLKKQGCDIGGLGAEGHFSEYNPPEPVLLKARLDELWQLKIPIWLTEVDIIDRIPASRAEKLEYVLRTGFSHPGVEGIILWGFWAGNHWAGERASLWDKNWRINDAGIRLLSLKEEWKTKRVWDGVNSHQRYHFRGYHGSYVVRIQSGNETKEAKFEIVPGDGRQTVKIDFSAPPAISPDIATLEGSQMKITDLLRETKNASERTNKNNSYIGCYKDGPRRAMDGFFYTDHNSMTIEKCLSECRKRNFLFAGLEWRYECFCGNSYTMYGPRNESWCNRPCTGNTLQICGGGYSLSVYVVKSNKSNESNSNASSDTLQNTTRSTVLPKISSTPSDVLEDNYSNNTDNYTNEARTRTTLLEDDPNILATFKTLNSTKVAYIGCFPDNDPPRALDGRQRYVTTKMTLFLCFSHCIGFKYAGLQNSMECYCGNTYDRYGSLHADQWKCNSPCAGNASEICGGIMHNSVYRRENYDRESLTLGTYLGCWQDSLPKRTLQGSVLTSDSMTIAQCLTFCVNNDYVYGGLQFGMQCFCGNHYRSRQLPEINCNERCTGDSASFCGGSMANSVFHVQEYRNKTTLKVVSGKGKLQTTSVPPEEAQPTYTTIPIQNDVNGSSVLKKGTYIGCYGDRDPYRAMNRTQRYVAARMTVELCIKHCSKFRYAGLQYGTECFCSNNYDRYGKSGYCWAKCSGNTSQICGGNLVNSVYSTGEIGSFGVYEGSYLGCWLDDNPFGNMEGSSIRIRNMTVDVCLAFCRIEGYDFAGLQKGLECYCRNKYKTILQAESFCYLPCSGNSLTACGGHSRNSVFSVTGKY
ncbi:uncharacterized protein LOC115209445 isoform X2 [Octopus sinensis]|uniref:Uncharacterized protein LOC115209445 isoform X2 n=1 Tax=Octopus sinensis TaxID=2607531 RepID=A0A7E6EMI9_9MOLL|nr:uncharacterized protein LOC115209445 isoform X2 [Octopus sinensis]